MSLFDDDEEFYESQDAGRLQIAEDDDSDDSEPVEKKKRGENRSYRFLRAFDTTEEFKQWWEGDGETAGEKEKWRAMQKHTNKAVESEFFRCKFARRTNYKCPKVIRFDFSAEDESVLVFETVNDHHDEPEEAEPLSDQTKTAILELMKTGLPPLRIHNALIAKKVEPLPSLLQVQNVCKRARRETGGVAFTVEQVRKYCEENVEVPEGADEAYVVHHVVESAERFCVIWTTRKLIEKHAGKEIIQVDSTCKTNWYGYPVQMAGFSDANKCFHPTLLCVSYSEDTWTYKEMLVTLREKGVSAAVVLGDGAKEITAAVRESFEGAIRAMCWSHVVRQVDKRLGSFSKELRARLREEFHLLQFVKDEEEFVKVSGLLFDSWPGEAQELISYLCKVWIQSPEHFWYESAHQFGTTDNGLEAHNRLIKKAHTLRRLLPFPQFLKEAHSIVKGWSVRSEEPAEKPDIKPNVFHEAYKLSKSGRLWRKLSGKDGFVFAAEDSKIKSKEELAQAYELFANGAFASFDDFKQVRFKVHVVERSSTGDFYRCTCPVGSKKIMCKHATMVHCMPAVGLATYPPDASAELLSKKKKVGRPSQKAGRPRLAETQNRHAVAN